MTILKVSMQVVNNAVRLMAPMARPVASIVNVDVKTFESIVNRTCAVLEPWGVGMVGWSPEGPQPRFTIEIRREAEVASCPKQIPNLPCATARDFCNEGCTTILDFIDGQGKESCHIQIRNVTTESRADTTNGKGRPVTIRTGHIQLPKLAPGTISIGFGLRPA